MTTKLAKQSAVILAGSPRKKGNTSVLIDWLEDALRKENWEIKKHDLYGMSIRGCSACQACKRVIDQPGCYIKDDFTSVLDQIAHAELVVIASPVYCWSVSGCESAALDRFYCFFKNDKSLIEGKKIVGVFTGGGTAFDGIDLCVEMLKRLCEFGKADYAGSLTAANATSPENMFKREDLKQAAADLVKGL